MYYEKQYHIDGRDTDHRGQCRMSALLGFLQECGAEAATGIGLSHQKMLEKYQGFWMLVRVWVELEAPICWNETLTIRTWHRQSKGITSYRDFDFFRDGQYVGQAISAWVLANAESHKLLRLDKISEFREHGGEGLGKTKTLSHLKLPAGLKEVERRRLHYSEQDINGHINNTRYADYACDALEMENMGKDSFIRTMQLGFLAECHAGEELILLTGAGDGMDYVRGTGEDGKSRFEAALTIEKVK